MHGTSTADMPGKSIRTSTLIDVARGRLKRLGHFEPAHNALKRPVRWSVVLTGVALVVAALALLPDRTRIPPFVASDYCYLLTAADRLYEGHGLTTPLPFAPLQPWTWQGDWVFLTQWPAGYPLLVCAVRWVSGVSTIQAGQWISVLSCAAALVGWFVWVRRCLPDGLAGALLAAVAAGCSVSTATLLNPSTDALLVAVLPFALLFTDQAIHHLQPGTTRADERRALAWLALSGLTAGGLVWIRYAAVFVPPAIGLHLLMVRRRTPRLGAGKVAAFALCAAAPIVTLLLINRMLGAVPSVQAQLNLGHAIGFGFSFDLLARAWWKLTEFGFYDYHWYSRWVFAIWPLMVIAAALSVPFVRRMVRRFFGAPGVLLSALVVLVLLAMLIGATTVFGKKYDYVGLDRYYMVAKPLYFLLFVGPLLMIPWRVIRVALCVASLVACSWLVQQEWPRPYRRWLAAERELTPYGAWSYVFRPNAPNLYAWLAEQDRPNLIVVSNFQEYITLHTKIPALPIPKDVNALEESIQRICEARSTAEPRVLFVLDADDRTRDYFLKLPYEIIEDFNLSPCADVPQAVSALVFEYAPDTRQDRAEGA